MIATVGALILAGALLGALHDRDATIIKKSVLIHSLQISDQFDLPRVLLGLTGRLEAILLVLSAAFAPVTVVTVVAVTTITAATPTATTTTTTAATTTTATSTSAGAAGIGGVDVAILDLLDLLVAVLLLALEDQISLLPLGLLLQSEEGLLLLLGLELNEDAALESLVVGAAQTDGVCGAIGGEESLDVQLCSGLLLTKAEALGVDGAGHGGVLEDLHGLGIVLVHGLGQRDLALDGGVVLSQLDVLGGLEGLNDRAEGLESAHALERVKELKGHGVVGAAANLGEKELVHREVGIGEVEFDLGCARQLRSCGRALSNGSYLLADLHRVVGYFLGGGIELGVVLARATVTAAIALEGAGLALLSLGLCGLLLGLLRLLSELSSFGDNAGLVGVLGGLLCGAFLLQLGEDILNILLSLGVDNWGLLFFGHSCELYVETISVEKKKNDKQEDSTRRRCQRKQKMQVNKGLERFMDNLGT